MIGRANDKIKRFELGIRAMKHIISEVSQSELKLICLLLSVFKLKIFILCLSIIFLISFKISKYSSLYSSIALLLAFFIYFKY